MNKQINLIAFGTFGNPNGFKQTFFKGDKELEKQVRTFDLKTEAIKLFPQSRLYAIRKELVGKQQCISYAAYAFAREQNSERGGTFIGCGILFVHQIADEQITISLLNEFHQNLMAKNTENNVIIVRHSNDFTVSHLRDFDKLEHNLRVVEGVNFEKFTHQNAVVYSELNANKLQQRMKKSLELLNKYDTIYFTESSEIAEFVHRQGIFKLLQIEDFEEEIENQRQEKLQYQAAIIAELEQEKKIAQEQRKKRIDKQKTQVADSEKVHKENAKRIEELKNGISNLEQKYAVYLKKIEDSILQIKSGAKPEKVRQSYEGIKKSFVESINQSITPSQMASIQASNSGPDTKQSWKPSSQEFLDRSKENESGENGSAFNIYKLSSMVLLLMLVGTFTYFLYFQKEESTQLAVTQPVSSAVYDSGLGAVDTLLPLSPEPNFELSKNAYELLHTKPIKLMEAAQIVRTIFETYPVEIKNSYADQAALYADHLVQLNKECFEHRDSSYYFVRDTLRHIPAYATSPVPGK